MAVAGINSVSVLESSYLGENYSPVSRRWTNQERPITRTSVIRKMWRELEGESRFREDERQSPRGMVNGNMGSQCSCSSGQTESDDASINTSEVENECPQDQNPIGLQNGQEDNESLCVKHSPALGVADKQHVRQVFREWGSKNSSGHVSNISHKNNCSRVRAVRQWLESNTQQAEIGHSGIEDQAPENHTGVGAQRSIRRLYGRQVLLDLLTRFERERKKEVQSLLEHRLVSTFAYRNRIQSLLRGRFLWNQRFIQDEKSTIAASELGLLRQTQAVSDLRKGFLSRLDSYERIHDGPQSDTSSDNDMKYEDENFQELPDDIVNEVETINTNIDLSVTSHKGDFETDPCGSPGEYAAPNEFIETGDQNREDSVERNQGAHSSTILDGQDQPDGEEPEVHEAFDRLNSSEINEDSLSWQEPTIEDDGVELHDLTNMESNEGLEANLILNEDEWYQETAGSAIQESHDGSYDNAMEDTTESWFGGTSYLEAPPVVRRDVTYDDDNGNRLELQELMSRGRVSNLLQSDFRVRLDQLIQSYVERQDQTSESDDEWMLEREQQNQDQDQNVEREQQDQDQDQEQDQQDDSFLDVADWQHPNIHQHFGTEWEIINGLRFDMVTLQERMNTMQRTLETCMNMQLELQHSLQQEVSSALIRSSTSGLQKDESKGDCFLCCDSSSDSSPNRCGHVYVCSKCAEKINWSKLKESVRHP